jgi:hypothetical protein
MVNSLELCQQLNPYGLLLFDAQCSISILSGHLDYYADFAILNNRNYFLRIDEPKHVVPFCQIRPLICVVMGTWLDRAFQQPTSIV